VQYIRQVGSSDGHATRTPDGFESTLRDYLRERAEETRAVRVGLKGTSEQAAIIARYTDLFTSEQLEALRTAERAEVDDDARERLYRLRATCESGIVATRLAPLHDALQNAELSARVELGDEEIPLRAASARLSVLSSYAEREVLGKRVWDASAALDPIRRELQAAREELRAELSAEPDPIRRNESEKGISLRRLADVVSDAASVMSATYSDLRDRWLDRILGSDRPPVPASYHAPFVYRLAALADVYAKDRSTEVCVTTLRDLGFDLARSGVSADLEDRPQKAPRPAVIPSDPPALVHLITRPLGGLQDYVSLLHEAGHALHFAGCDPALPYAFRKLSRDNALTEVYSYTVQAITREPGWHAAHFGLPAELAAENAEAASFLDAFVFRRNAAKLRFELAYWGRFGTQGGTGNGYAERLTEATGFAYRADRHLADMDADFYCADYLRAAVRSAQLRMFLRAEVGDDWWRSAETGELLRELFARGTRPANEDLAARFGFDAWDTGPLVAELAQAGAMRPA
jgi:hypothetical protein